MPAECRPVVTVMRGFKPVKSGFTLVELLVAMVAVQVVFIAAGSVLISHVRSSSSLELAQRQRDNAGRLDYLVQVEAGEAALVEVGLVLPAGCEAPGQAAIAAFRVPRDSGNYLDTVGNVSFIFYYNHQGNVRRCGPPVNRNGVLNHAAGQDLHDGVAVRDARIELVSCQGQSTDSSQLVYRLVYPSGYQPACSIARARTVFIR
jgi:prepilin-type N-terminal cleavage/methylation domain-containing protein